MCRRVLFVIVCVLTAAQFSCAKPAASLAEYRMWQFHTMDVNYVSAVLKIAPQYNINAVVFSHGMNYAISDFADKGSMRSQQHIRLAKEAHQLGLKVYIWPHEFEKMPEKFLKNNVVQMDTPGLFEYITEKYDTFFKEFPEIDGIVLTFHETTYPVFSDAHVNSSLPKPERFARMINAIDEACVKYNKDFIVRTFLYQPEEYAWLTEGLQKTHSRVMVQSKEVPHDWQPYYPNGPDIGAFPGRKQIVEFDCSSEFTGKNRIPFTSPEYFEMRWRWDLTHPEVIGYNARIDHGGFDAVFTPNALNLYALYRLTEDPNIKAADIWKEWTVKTYGAKAAPYVEKVLRPTFECVKLAFFAKGFWYTCHSYLPLFGYAGGSITGRTTAKWVPNDPNLKKTEQLLVKPTPEFFEEILAQKDEAIALADEAKLNLRCAKPYLTPAQYDDLRWRLDLLGRVAQVWKLHAEAFWGYTLLEQRDIPGLRQRVQRAIDGLYAQAKISEQDPLIGSAPPASATEIKAAADELQTKLMKFRSTK